MNEVEPFSFSLDWGNEFALSLLWIARAWAIAAVCTMVLLVLIARYTVWGQQFWRITGPYFTGEHRVRVWLWLAALLLSVIVGVRLDVLFSYQGNDMFSSAQMSRRRRRRASAIGTTGLLDVAAHLRGLGNPVCRAHHARPVHDAAVHACLAEVVDRPTHRRLARRSRLLPHPVHRPHHRQSRPAHPGRHRHLHRRRQFPAEHAQQLHQEHPACSARSMRWCR